MVWQQWVYAGWMLFSCLVIVGSVGKPRQPYTPAMAVASIIVSILFVLLVLSIGHI